MQALTIDEFEAARENEPYYGGRWAYISKAIEMAESVCPESVIELGPFQLPLYVGGDIIDNDPSKLPNKERYKKWFNFDAADLPWPIEDNAYDLFVAMQVWEHLADDRSCDKRRAAFREVKRIAKAAVLSFPYRWVHAAPWNRHYNIDDDLIRGWTTNDVPEKEAICEQPGSFFAHHSPTRTKVLKRKICLWIFDESKPDKFA